jgi:Ion channel
MQPSLPILADMSADGPGPMLTTLAGTVLLLLALGDAFEAMVLPRRITRRWRLTRLFYRPTWALWRRAALRLPAGRYRQNAFSIFGPLSVLGLFGCWIFLLISGFALIAWGQHTLAGEAGQDFRQCLYHSGETFFTLGYGDVTPITYTGKLLSVLEAGCGFGFMAIVIGYLPVLFQAFSRREQSIALLDARAGSPPTAGELLRRSRRPETCRDLERFLIEWEVWAAELLESHLSFPVLGYYRSQHDNQSWLAALSTILDTSAILLVTGSDECRRRAELTFAMARHASVDLCLIFGLRPPQSAPERITTEEFASMIVGTSATPDAIREQFQRLASLRELYEPFVAALGTHFCLLLPRFIPDRATPDNWQTSAWTKRAPGITELPAPGASRAGEHFGSEP